MAALPRASLAISGILTLFLFSSCTFRSFGGISPDVVEYFEWVKKQEALFDKYLGKSSQEIEAIFGKPKNIYRANPPSYILPHYADEMWRYVHLPVGEAASYDFLFKEGYLIGVQVI